MVVFYGLVIQKNPLFKPFVESKTESLSVEYNRLILETLQGRIYTDELKQSGLQGL